MFEVQDPTVSSSGHGDNLIACDILLAKPNFSWHHFKMNGSANGHFCQIHPLHDHEAECTIIR